MALKHESGARPSSFFGRARAASAVYRLARLRNRRPMHPPAALLDGLGDRSDEKTVPRTAMPSPDDQEPCSMKRPLPSDECTGQAIRQSLAGARAIAVLKPRDDLLVLCYHAISREWPSELAVTPQRLAAQLRLLESRGYRGVRFSDAVLGSSRSGRRVAVTFDDGYSSVLALAKPILDEFGWPATLFVPTDYIGTECPMSWPGIEGWIGGRYEHELMPLGWDGVRELQAGGWEIGAHTCSHPHLTTLSHGDVRRELVTAKAVCERELERECLSIAYPYGDADKGVIAAAAEVGYRTGAALAERPHPPHPLYWPRVGVYRADDELRFRRRISRGTRLVEQTLAWPAATKGLHLLTSRLLPADAVEGTTPAMLLLASHGVLIRSRAGTAAAGLAGRLGLSAVHVLWPDAISPRLVTSPTAPHTLAWMTQTCESLEQYHDPTHAAKRRPRAVFIGRGTGRAVELAEAALGHTLTDPHVAIFSASDSRCGKALAFVWHDGNDEPSFVVKCMPYPLHPCPLRHEREVLVYLREQLGDHWLAATLPPAPLIVEDRDGSYTVVEPVAALAGRHVAVEHARAERWLRALHSRLQSVRPWGLEDEGTVLERTRRAYREAGVGDQSALCERMRAELIPLRGASVPLVVEHRDFWSGAIHANADELFVYDWEWARLEGRPFFDLWTYELAELRRFENGGEADDAARLQSSTHRVEAELLVRGIDPAFARLMLPFVIGEIVLSGDRGTRRCFPEWQWLRMMRAAERLVLDS